jgi:hypothetical protein
MTLTANAPALTLLALAAAAAWMVMTPMNPPVVDGGRITQTDGTTLALTAAP